MVARTDASEPGRSVVEAAAEWHAKLADESCSEADRDACEQWLAASTMHRTAFDRMGAFASHLGERTPVERAALTLLLDRQGSKWSIALLPALATVGALTWWASGDAGVRARIADSSTAVGEQHSELLRTGDRLTLDTNSAADIDGRRRSISLWRGAIMADVAKGQPGPFIIRTPDGTAEALGTRYSVRIEGEATIVRVMESRVRACASQGNGQCLLLDAGQAVRLDRAGASRIGDIDPATEEALMQGFLVVDDRPLAEVLDMLNRYRTRPIGYTASDIAGLHVSGSFPLTDTDRALVSLQAALPVTTTTGPDGPIIKRR